MPLKVHRIENRHLTSNTFVIQTLSSNDCLIVDPGAEDNQDLNDYMLAHGLSPSHVFLTHEHFDHIWGVNGLRDQYQFHLVATSLCSEYITDRRKNMSLYYNQVGFELKPANMVVEDTAYRMFWNNIELEFIATPGHSEASMCILIGDNLFTGDTLIKDKKTVTKLPGGSREKLANSLLLLERRFRNSDVLIHGGHGDCFSSKDLIADKYLT